MPPRRFNPNQQRGSRGRNPRQGGQQAGYSFERELFGGEPQLDSRFVYYPRTTEALVRGKAGLAEPFRERLGLAADEIEISPDRVEIEIDRRGELVRESDRVPAEDLATRDELAEQSITVERDGKETEIEGQFPIDVATALIIGDRAVAFRRPEFDFVRGESGAVGPLQELPGLGIRTEIGEEHFIIAKQRGEEVIVTLQTHEPESRQVNRVLQTKERVLQAKRAQLSALMSEPRANKEAIAKLNEIIRTLDKSRRIVFAKEQGLPKGAEEGMVNIEVKINGDRDRLKGFVHFDAQRKSMTVARPVRIDPEAHSLDPASIKIYDGTGLDRETRFVAEAERSLSPIMQDMVRNLHRPEVVQQADKAVSLPNRLKAALYRDPRYVLQLK